MPTAPFVLGAVCLLTGLPFALLLARARGGRSPAAIVAVEAVLLGLGWHLLLGTVLAHRQELGRGQILGVSALAVAAATAALLARRPRRWVGVVDRPQPTLVGAAITVAFVVGVAMRDRPSYFLYQIGDFGEYVNRGNVLADGGPFGTWFTHGFSVMLALGHLALGEAREVEIMSFLGLAVMAGVLAVGQRVGLSGLARVVVAAVFAIGVVPVWFSTFPASETLYVLWQLALLLFLVGAVAHRHVPMAVVGGAFALPLMLTRGNALLMLPIALGLLLVTSVVVRRDAMRVVVAFTVSTAAALFVGFVYNSRFSYPYFIEFQMPQFFPERVWRLFDDLGGLRMAAAKGLVVAIGVGAVVVLALRLNARVGPPADARWLRTARSALLPAVLVLAVLSLVWPLDAGALREALARYDPAVYALAAAGFVLACVRFGRDAPDHVRVALVQIVIVGTAFALLHAYRFPTPRYAPYYLYWDRYLWSELYPLLVVVAGFGVMVLERGWARLDRPALRVGGGAAAVVLALGAGAQLWSAGALSREHTFLGDPYGDLSRVDDLSAGLPIVYVGIDREDVPRELYHPNTFRLFAIPLAQTFGHRILNVRLHPYAHDPQPTIAEAARLLQDAGYERGALVEVVSPRATPRDARVPSGVEVTTLGTVEIEIPMLDRPLWREPDGWRVVHVELAVRQLVIS